MEQLKLQLQELRLSGMANSLEALYETREVHKLSLIDGLKFLIQAETDVRWNNKYARLMKNANFRYSASINQVTPSAARNLDAGQLSILATGHYVKNGESIIITGATGCGKSFLASAFGHQACKQGYSVAYYNIQKLMAKLKADRLEGQLIKSMEKLAKTDLLILDDFGLIPLSSNNQNDLMEIIEDRHAKRSTIIASQLPVSVWFDVFPEATVADALLDRMANASHRIELKGSSLRKKK